MSPGSTVAAGGSGRSWLRPRLTTYRSMSRSAASHEQAELMTPLPPMNSTLSRISPTLEPASDGAVAGRSACSPAVGAGPDVGELLGDPVVHVVAADAPGHRGQRVTAGAGRQVERVLDPVREPLDVERV